MNKETKKYIGLGVAALALVVLYLYNKKTVPIQYDCDWVKSDRKIYDDLISKRNEENRKNYPDGDYPVSGAPYFQRYSQEQRDAYKKCGIELPFIL